MRDFHARGEPHLAVQLALDTICGRDFRDLAYDLIKARCVPTPKQQRRADQERRTGVESAAASGELSDDQLALLFDDSVTLADDVGVFGRLGTHMAAQLRGAASATPAGAASRAPAGAAPVGRALVPLKFVPGRGAGDDAVTLENLLRYLRNLASGAGGLFLCKIEALAGAGRTVFVDVFGPSWNDLVAPWARRELKGLVGRAALTRETALVMAAAPAEMLYWPPRPKDFFFWSRTVQKSTARTASLLGVVRLKLRE